MTHSMPPASAVRKKLTRTRWRRRVGVVVGLVLAGMTLWFGSHWLQRGMAAARDAPAQLDWVPSVEVIQPTRGGVRRTTVQPGSVFGFESVDLYAMVSGYLKTQVVDIGSRIKKGEVLAVIDAPREARAVDEAVALVGEFEAKTQQAEARIKTMQGDRDAAAAAVKQAESDIDRLVAAKAYAEKQHTRVKGLVADRASTTQLLDENQRLVETALAAERTGQLAVLTAKAQLATANAKVDQARADAVEARSAVEVARARLATARVNLDYTRILAPFDGVVTFRAFHPGAFLRSATEGGQSPLLTVKRTDLMRVVVQVPERDVMAANVGDPANFKVDALGGHALSGTVARIAESEDPTTRTMRVEIDLPNPKGLLREGMYGTVTLSLEPDSRNLTLPPACVIEHSGQSHGVVYLVRDGLARRAQVELGADNGTLVEVLAGLEPDDGVVLRSGIPLEDGMAVVPAPETTADAGQ